MAKFTILISIVLLAASLFLLIDKLFTPQPIQITLLSGQEITTSTAEYYAFTEVLLLISCAFLIGSAATYLFYNSDRAIKNQKQPASLKGQNEFTNILPLLKPDQRNVIRTLLEANGEMHQNKLSSKLNLSKVKTTRILYRLEHKNLITKERHGFTNMVRLRKKSEIN